MGQASGAARTESQAPGVQWPAVTRPAGNTDALLLLSAPRMCACAGTRSTTKNPGARCAPARSISRGSRPSAVTSLLPPCRPAPARLADALSPNEPGPSRCCLAHQRAAARNLCPRTLLASVPRQPAASGARPSAVPGAHSPRGRDRAWCRGSASPGHPARLWPPSPQLAGTLTSGARCCRPRRPPRASWPHPEARTDGSAQRINASNVGGSRHR
jgi:hypothetical protein